jgi:hypothetical protein
MSDLLFAVPWWLFISLIAAGCIVFWSGNNRNQNGPRMVGIGLVVIALLLKGISFFVETDKEKCERQTNELVKAVQSRDWSKFGSLLDPDVSLDTSVGSIFANSLALVDGAKADCERYNLTNLSARVTDVQQDATGVTVDIDASSEMTASMGYSVPSSWKLIWDRTGKDWKLHEITCLRIGQEKPEQMAREIK